MIRSVRRSDFLKFAILILLCASPAFAQERWTGRYEFEESGGKTSGGTAVVVSHEIEVFETDDGLIAMIKSQGFQTSRDLVCKARIEGAKMLLFFESYGEDNVLATYKDGELLLTLERKKDELLTHWGAFQPVTGNYAKSGKVYFQKVKTVEE